MLTAVVLHPPRFGATVSAVDDQAAVAEASLTAVVPIAEGVAVVAETVADAQRGVRALAVEWNDTNAERRSTPELLAEHVRLLESGENAMIARDDGDVDRALAGATWTVDATYVLPYLAHGPMEPNNAACRMREDGVLDVCVGTEAPSARARSRAGRLGLTTPRREGARDHQLWLSRPQRPGHGGLARPARPRPCRPDRVRARLREKRQPRPHPRASGRGPAVGSERRRVGRDRSRRGRRSASSWSSYVRSRRGPKSP